MNKVAFYGGLILMLVGLLVWIVRPNQRTGRSEISFFGAKFMFDTPAFAVMVIGLALMLFSPRFPDQLFGPGPELPLLPKVARVEVEGVKTPVVGSGVLEGRLSFGARIASASAC
jgi:hypothetical protein